jgi:hypothetical protein
MILQVLSDAGQVLDHLDPMPLEQRPVSNAGKLKELRRSDGACRHDDFMAGSYAAQAPVLKDFDSDRTPSLEENACRMGMSLDR